MDQLDAVVTGATGLVGRWLVPLLTQRGQQVGVLVRGAARRATEYRTWVDAHGGDAARVRFFEADLGLPDLGLSPSDIEVLRTAKDFHHAGAMMKFGLGLEEARRINVEGARTLYRIAKEAPRLRRIIHVGGFKIRGDVPGAALERLGAYERSKIEADLVARELEREGLPVTRVQLGAVIGDAMTGETTQLWGFADLVRDLFHGRIPAVIGGAGWWMPLVTVDFVAKFMASVPELEDAAGEYVLLDDASPELVELFERIARHLGVGSVQRTVPKAPLEWFLRMGGERLLGVSAEAISFIEAERYDVHETKRAAAAMGVAFPDIQAAVLRTVDFLVATRFGERARRSDGAGMRRVGGIPTFVEGAPAASDVLYLHGIPLDASSWDGVLEALEEELAGPDRLSAAAADLPGLARTTRTTRHPADWVESLLSGHPKRPWIVAHSLGTRYAVEHAARHPDRVSGLVLVSPFFLQAPPPAFLRNATLASVAFSMMRDSDLVKLVGEKWAAAPRAWLSRPGARSRIARALADAHAVRGELARAMRELDVPVVIVVGERDPLVEDAGTSEVVTIAGTGHFPQLDAPGAVAEVIRRFVLRKRPAVVRVA